MPSNVYTETFLYATGLNVTTSWAVPTGKRAVITSMVATAAATGGVALVRVHGRVAAFFGTPAVNSTVNLACKIVAYEHWTISCFTNNVADIHVHISGYLFDDPEGPSGPPGIVERRPVEFPDPIEQLLVR